MREKPIVGSLEEALEMVRKRASAGRGDGAKTGSLKTLITELSVSAGIAAGKKAADKCLLDALTHGPTLRAGARSPKRAL